MRIACKKTRKKLPAFLNRQLEGKTEKEVAHHIATCPLCKGEAEDLRSTWDLLGRASIDKDFPDILSGVLERIDREGVKSSLLQKFAEKFIRIPAPALCLLIFLFAIPPGVLLGKNLYFIMSAHQNETHISYSEEIPLDVFSDFPVQSLENVYLTMATDSFEEDL
jgi:hypothetical protein